MTVHLIQSTLFAALVWLAALLLRDNAAKYRHALWMAASIKFLIPFSVLVTLGSLFEWRTSSTEPTKPFPRAMLALAEATRPVLPLRHPQPAPSQFPVERLFLAVWIAGGVAVTISRVVRWRRAASDLALEPGVFGIAKPVLRIPQCVIEALPEDQLESVIAHERCHIERHDNLAAAVHMLVESLFWFHPAVWWIGTRLIEERERACDEAVVLRIHDRETYAQAILNVARICLQSPVACVSGVTGSDLTRRIERIMTAPAIDRLSNLKRSALAALTIAVVGAPVLAGVAGNARAQSPSARLTFEAASIKVSKDNNPRTFGGVRFLPGGKAVGTGVPLILLIAAAYDLPFQSSRISLAPGVKPPNENYDIEAVGPSSDFPPGISVQARNAKIRLMLQALLADRFHMKIRIDPREQPVYALAVGKGGPKLEKSKMTQQECDTSDRELFNAESCHGVGGGQGRGIHGAAVTIADVALFVQNWSDKPVIDETGLKDLYNIQTEGWTPMRIRPPNPDGSAPSGGDAGLNDPDRQTLFKVFEQLGLRMEAKRAVVDMYVVEAVEKPTGN